jgi:uncharacterized protein YbdZ (MbtH family)
MNRCFFKRIQLVLLFLFLLSAVAGCGGRTDTPDAIAGFDIPKGSQTSEPEQSDHESEEVFPGSYAVPGGWVKAEQYSTENKVFYVEEGHEQFRDAIVRQLMVQMQGIDAELTGDGTYTEQGEVVYIFTISEEDVVTKQYYIVGEQQYCLIHLTSYSGSESTESAAHSMVDSFIWN